MSKKVLMATANYWTSPYYVGSHHYAKFFADNGWKVLFVSDPISPFHFLVKSGKRETLERYKIYRGEIKSGYGNVRIYVPFTLFTPNEKPLFSSHFVANNWHKLTVPDIGKYVEKIGFDKVDLLWFDSFVQHFWINKIRYKKSIFRVADKSAFKKINPALRKLEKDLISKVDFLIYTAKSLELYLSGYKDKLVYIPNGVNIEYFLKSDRTMPEELGNIPKPIAIYIGAISDWFDVDLLSEVVRKCRDISFVLIGQRNIDISKLQKEPNIYYLGKKDYSEISKYMYNSNVGIIPFNVQHPVIECVNPLKLYEYMACELPVVATKWKELELIRSPAYLAEDADDFTNALKEALKEKYISKYLKFAKSNTWEERFKRLAKICLGSK